MSVFYKSRKEEILSTGPYIVIVVNIEYMFYMAEEPASARE